MFKRLAAIVGLGLAALTPAASAQQAQPANGFTVVFSVQARGITAGEFTLTTNFTGSTYEVTANRRMTGLVRAAVGSSQDYRYSVRGAIVNGQLRPQDYQHQGGSRNRLVQARFSPEDIVTTATPQMGMGTPPATQAQRRGAIDQLTAMASMVIATGDPCSRSIAVYMDGRSRFDFVLTPNGRQRVNAAGFNGEAIRCRVQFRPIAGFSDPQQPATLTFLFGRMPNGMYAPLRIEMPSDDAGVIRLQARSFETRGQRPS
ncbi:MAG: DUF3108 domain-containing protein [Hyphomonadaceae bacterium]